jgi:putative ABC transport system permease protein
MEKMLQDLKYGLRQLRKSPGFSAIAIITLALGIAINATMFSLVSAFLLRRPPGHEPERLAVVTSIDPSRVFQPDTAAVSAPNYLAWREANHVFDDMAAADEYRSMNLTLQRESQVLNSAAVSPNYFSIIGVTPQFGRTFAAGEDQAGKDRVVILSHDLWEKHFASDPLLIGRTIRLDREPFTVVGIMPESFRFLGFTPQVWTPLVLSKDQTVAARKNRFLFLFGRLKSGVNIEQAHAEFVTLADHAAQMFPESDKGFGVAVRTLPDFLIYDFGIRSGLAVLMTTVAFVLLIACANVAGLLLARAAGRSKEFAIRGALGAGRLRIIRQLLTEGFAISLFGGGLGVVLSYWGIQLVRASMTFNDAIQAVPLTLDLNVLLFTAGISIISAVLCGLAPAWKGSRTDVATNLKDGTRAASAGRAHTRLRTAMVSGEIALALFLLVGVGLLVREIFVIEHQNLGFRPDHLLTANVTLDNARYQDNSEQINFVRDLLPRLQNAPGVQAVAAVSELPATGPGRVSIRIKDQADIAVNQQQSALHFVITPDYFRTAGIGVLGGRAFTETDNASAPRVVLVNQEFVHRFLHDQQPVAKQIRTNGDAEKPEWMEIVGVVSNVKSYSEGPRDEPEIYESFLQRPQSSFALMLRTTSDPNGVVSDLRAAVAQLDSDLPLDQVKSMASVIESQKAGNVFFVRVLAIFAFMALLLAAIGIYGLIAYSVGQRTHEIGIRMALGAKSQDVLRMVLGEGIKMVAIGGAVGVAMALPLPRLFDAIFVDMHVSEPRLYIVVPIVILVVALIATYIPARRAARVNPMSALRQE